MDQYYILSFKILWHFMGSSEWKHLAFKYIGKVSLSNRRTFNYLCSPKVPNGQFWTNVNSTCAYLAS
uniref:Uncharacterized protein n=1 Tax=Rhizophora mucronata TaxID=61149 RepID=A0A2P2PT62_RHIMU